MEEALESLNVHLEHTLQHFNGNHIQRELQEALHNHGENSLPRAEIAALANKSIDLLHEIEQLLEPAHLVLADHFLGTTPTEGKQ